MDFEDALVALIDEDEMEYVHELFQTLADLYKDMIGRMKKYYNIDAIFLHDDWGGQRAPFFSADVVREMIAPYIKQVVDYCHSIDVVFDFHSCGKIELLVPVMIECGIDKWAGQPLNDKKALIAQYGDKIVIGATDTVCNSPDSVGLSPEEIGKRADAFMEEYTKGGKDKLFFVQDFFTNDTERAALYERTRKFLSA